MELIKQIRDAEEKVKRLLEEAKKNASIAIENENKSQLQQFEQARKSRISEIDRLKMEGAAYGKRQAQQLAEEADKKKQIFINAALQRKDAASWKIVDFIKNRPANKK